MNYYTADTHFGHANVLKYCPGRIHKGESFPNIQEHDKRLKLNWNETVGKDDETTIIGDFAFADITVIKGILQSLNGVKHLIIGNHDREPWEKYIDAGFETVQRYKFIHIPKVGAVGLAHDPSCCIICPTIPWLVGHLHHQFIRMGNAINVGVDVRNLKPVSEYDLMEDFKVAKMHMKIDPNAKKEILGIE